MTAPEAALATDATNSAAIAGDFTVATRFGPIAGRWEDVIEMPQGPLGFTQHRRFALLTAPNPKLNQFRLMQSLEDADLSFIVMPCPTDGGPILKVDLAEACTAIGITLDDLQLVLIVTVRTVGDVVELSANLRAPVLVDTRRHIARQIVLANPTYPVRQAIGSAQAAA
jgi:flagellar assembly factor FliW